MLTIFGPCGSFAAAVGDNGIFSKEPLEPEDAVGDRNRWGMRCEIQFRLPDAMDPFCDPFVGEGIDMRRSLFLLSLFLPSRNADIVNADISISAEDVMEGESVSEQRGNAVGTFDSSGTVCVRLMSAA